TGPTPCQRPDQCRWNGPTSVQKLAPLRDDRVLTEARQDFGLIDPVAASLDDRTDEVHQEPVSAGAARYHDPCEPQSSGSAPTCDTTGMTPYFMASISAIEP